MRRARERVDIPEALEMIERGMYTREIAEHFVVSPTALVRLMTDDPEVRQAYEQAMRNSAEALLDRAMQTLEHASNTENNARVMAAKAMADMLTRRAAIRNERYRDNHKIEHSGPGGGPMQVEEIRRTVVKPASE